MGHTPCFSKALLSKFLKQLENILKKSQKVLIIKLTVKRKRIRAEELTSSQQYLGRSIENIENAVFQASDRCLDFSLKSGHSRVVPVGHSPHDCIWSWWLWKWSWSFWNFKISRTSCRLWKTGPIHSWKYFQHSYLGAECRVLRSMRCRSARGLTWIVFLPAGLRGPGSTTVLANIAVQDFRPWTCSLPVTPSRLCSSGLLRGWELLKHWNKLQWPVVWGWPKIYFLQYMSTLAYSKWCSAPAGCGQHDGEDNATAGMLYCDKLPSPYSSLRSRLITPSITESRSPAS